MPNPTFIFRGHGPIGPKYSLPLDPEERVNLALDPICADTVAALERWLEPILATEGARYAAGS